MYATTLLACCVALIDSLSTAPTLITRDIIVIVTLPLYPTQFLTASQHAQLTIEQFIVNDLTGSLQNGQVPLIIVP
jgi:hypothetical protein